MTWKIIIKLGISETLLSNTDSAINLPFVGDEYGGGEGSGKQTDNNGGSAGEGGESGDGRDAPSDRTHDRFRGESIEELLTNN